MQKREITVEYQGTFVGKIHFRTTEIRARRALDGLALTIPAEIELTNKYVEGNPHVSSVRAIVECFDHALGVAEDFKFHTGNRAEGSPEQMELSIALPATVVRGLEHRRQGADLMLSLNVWTSVSILRQVPRFRRMEHDTRQAEILLDGQVVAFRPHYGEPIQSFGSVTVNVAALSWSNILTATGYGDNVFVEIPLPPDPGPPWSDVWRALRTARDAFNRGGATAWKTTITECRTALEAWREIEVPDLGPGLPHPNREQRDARTWQQRLDQVRWHIHHLASDGVHGHALDYTREDAALVLATLAGLLAIRNR